MAIRIHNLYCDEAGESHWRDIQIDWAQEGPEGKTSQRLPATGIIFRQTQAEHDLPWHTAPRRQYIINLDAGVELTASDGESRVIGAGEVVLVEDTSGKGHLSKSVNNQMRHSIFVPIE
jgi:quercetin dioxygenase-like cupin family protein